MSTSQRTGGVWLPVMFSSMLLDTEPSDHRFEAAIANGRIELRGCLTAVGRGWRLGATATCRRRRIALNVTAKEREEGHPPSIRHYRYEAVLNGLLPGRYSLRVSHMYGIGTGGYIGLGVPTFESAFLVP